MNKSEKEKPVMCQNSLYLGWLEARTRLKLGAADSEWSRLGNGARDEKGARQD